MSVEQLSEGDSGADVSIDWQAFFDEHDLHGSAFNQVATWVELADGSRTEQQAKAIVSGAKDDGGIVTDEGKHYPAGCLPEVESDDTTEDASEDTFSGEKQVSGPESVVEVSESRLDELEERVARAEAEARQANHRAEVAIEAVGQLVGLGGSGQIVVDEVAEQARKTGNQIGHMSQTITKVSQQLESLGEVDDNGSFSKEDRIHSLRRHVVEKSHENDSAYGMDYKAVSAFFDGKDASISTSYASNLLTEAAEGHHAFYVRKGESTNKQLAVKLGKIEDGSIFSVKNSSDEGGA